MRSVLVVLGSKDKSLMDKRVSLAGSIFISSNFDCIIFSGGNGEAEYMARKWNGDKFILESRSTTTLENLLFTRKIIGDTAYIVIVTDRSHVPRTRYLARRVFPCSKIEVISAPVTGGFLMKRFFYEFSRWVRHVFQ